MSGPTKAQLESQLNESKEENAGIKADMELLRQQVAGLTTQADIDINEPGENPLPDLSTNAIHRPVAIRKTLDAEDQQVGIENTMRFERNEVGDSVLVGTGLYDFDNPAFNEKLANLAFMQEMVEVHIQSSSDKAADPRFEIGVNGQTQFFVRGQTVVVARKFVEGLARAKPVMYENKEYTDAEGVRQVEYPSRSGLRYSFSVVRDPNPIGANWLKSVLAQ